MDLTPNLTISSTTKTPPHTQAQAQAQAHISNNQPLMVTYRECLKNHAASIGGYALDGCGDFMPNSLTTLNCAACGCHRNFHRREPDESRCHYRLHSSWLRLQSQHSSSPTSSRSPSPSSPTPLPISSHFPPPYYTSHSPSRIRLLSLDGGGSSCPPEDQDPKAENRIGRKRMRSKFSDEQKVKMQGFAEKMGWRLQKMDEGLVEEFCNEIGIHKRVFKIWIHNNKQSLMKGSHTNEAIADKVDHHDRNKGNQFCDFLHGSASSS